MFFDIGNVFSSDDTAFFEFDDEGNIEEVDYDFALDDLRQSVGMAVEWLSPMGVFRFSYGVPLNDEDEDQVEEFQFSIGSAF